MKLILTLIPIIMKNSETYYKRLSKISQKAIASGCKLDHMTIMMDLTHCDKGLGKDKQLNTINLESSSVANLLHDIYGINSNLDHKSYDLNCFLPRCGFQTIHHG